MKIGFFITARLKSTRLKRKILLDLNGRTVLERVIERCKATAGIDGVVLCSSTNPQDAELFEYARTERIEFYAGSENDVLQRLLDAAKHLHYDAFLSITADNPLFSIYSSQILVDKFKKDPYDFGFTKGLPIGLATSLLETKALDVAVHMKKEANTEIWGPFLNRSDFFNIFNLTIKNCPYYENKRLTLDYPEDYKLIKKIYSYFDTDKTISTQDLFKTLENNSQLWDINKNREQRWPTIEELDEINRNFERGITKGLVFAKLISKKLTPLLEEEIITFN